MTQQPIGTVPEEDVADRMRRALRFCGVSVQVIADYLGVSRTSVSNWINGRIEPSTQTLRLWALRTGVPFVWLKDGTIPSSGNGPDGGGNSITGELHGYAGKVFANFQRDRETGSRLVIPLRKVNPAAAAA